MIVTCPRCLTKFNLPEETLASGAELNFHCSRCGWDFLFSPQPEEEVHGVSAEALPAEVEEPGAVAEEMTDLDELEDEKSSVDVAPPALKDADDFIDEVFDDSIFELADDFDDEASSLDEQPVVQEGISGESEKSDEGDGEVKVEELALDIDDLNLDDIEFDSFDDEPDNVSEINQAQEEPQGVRPTQLDDEGDLDKIFNQVDEEHSDTVVSTVKERSDSGEQADVEPVVENLVSAPAQGAVSRKSYKKRSLIMALSCFVVLSLALWAAYGLWQRFSVDMVKHIQLIEVENKRLRLPSERTVIVLRGKVVNSSPKLVTDLKLTGVLLDEAGQVVVKVVTAGGVSFSEEELDRLDAGKLAMLENTTVTLAANGGELPFMIAFYDYPDKVSDCYVELTSFKVKKGRRP